MPLQYAELLQVAIDGSGDLERDRFLALGVVADAYVHRVIHPEEAATVHRIFSLYAEGKGLTKIAKLLNAERVPAPRTGSWAGTAIRDMLRRTTYMGVITWNRMQKVTRRGTKALRKRAATEWFTRPRPSWPSWTPNSGSGSRRAFRRRTPRSCGG